MSEQRLSAIWLVCCLKTHKKI